MAETQSKGAARLNGLIGLLVGIFGALAILGVTAKILKWDSLLGFDYNTVIMVGFMGEAAAFVAMGLLAFFHEAHHDHGVVVEAQERVPLQDLRRHTQDGERA
ncbi:MAG: hypothetical protein AAF970_19340, partial [Bacteroidota bacterium]